MHRLNLAVIDPANTPHGYNWTFAFPMLMFIVIAAILYALFSRPHHRVPGRRISAIGAGAGAAQATAVASAPATTSGAEEPAAEGTGESAADADAEDGSEASE